MIPAAHSALSGIRHGLNVLDRAAHNIANLNTEGFQRHEVVAREGSLGGVVSVTVPSEGGDLAGDLVAMIIARRTVGLNAGVLKRAEATVGSLIDILA